MPVTFKVSEHAANTFDRSKVTQPSGQLHPLDAPKSAVEVLEAASTDVKLVELIQSSVTDEELSNLIPSMNGFVFCALQAYNTHQNLIIRPDDVWITIMSQFSAYVNANSEKMKEYFVGNQEGKKKLVVHRMGNRQSVDWGEVADEFTQKLDENINDKTLRDFILPGFSTTTPTDTVVGAVVMMSTLKSYFSFGAMCMCGIPAVTLLGTKQDWVHIRSRLSKLLDFGTKEQHPELHWWYELLSPIIMNFVDAFDAFSPNMHHSLPTPRHPESSTSKADNQPKTETKRNSIDEALGHSLYSDPTAQSHHHNPHHHPSQRGAEIATFFRRIVGKEDNVSGAPYLTGWLSFFCAFDINGNWQLARNDYKKVDTIIFVEEQGQVGWTPKVDMAIFGEEHGPVGWTPKIDITKVPSACSEVEVFLNDNGDMMKTKMVAGMAGYSIEEEESLSPQPAWWIYVEEESGDKEEVAKNHAEWWADASVL